MLNKLQALKVTGPGSGHSRFLNLKVVDEIKQGVPKSLLGFTELQALPKEEILGAIARITGCSGDITVQEGPGYIDAQATLAGLQAAAELLFCIGRQKGNVLLATGHPGSMISFYLEAANIIRNLGGHILTPAAGNILKTYLCPGCGLHDTSDSIDYIWDVAVVTTGEVLLHTHDCLPMEIMLKSLQAAGKRVDLVVADHGFAGYAIKSGLPVIAVMDTNDPAIAASRLLGYNPVIIPMDDNLPNYVTAQVAKMMGELIAEQEEKR